MKPRTAKGEKAARDLHDAAAKDEKKTEEKMGHDLAKGADRFMTRPPLISGPRYHFLSHLDGTCPNPLHRY